MSDYVVFLDGIVLMPQVAEFLTGVQERTPRARLVLLIAASGEDAGQSSWTNTARHACDCLEELRDAGLTIAEAVVAEGGEDSLWQELERTDRAYDCAFRISPYRRGMHVQRLVAEGRTLEKLAG